jgi:FlaA1/EpsC-like NDP-sugar epimerase
MKSLLFRYRRCLIFGLHLVITVLSLAFAFLARFDFSLFGSQWSLLLKALWIVIPVKMAVFGLARVHRGWWLGASVTDLVRLLLANLIASFVFIMASLLLIGPAFPRSVYLVDFLLCFFFSGGARSAVRLYQESLVGQILRPGRKGMLIYGAGAAGRMLAREIISNPALDYRMVGFLDDDPLKRNAEIRGVPVLGTGREAPLIVDQHKNRSISIEEIVIAMPSASGRQMQEALANCRATGVACKTIPSIEELLNGKVLSAQIRNVRLDDLLGRDQVRLEEDRIQHMIMGQTVLVTGGAGSIGSELCRQVALYKPRRLIVFDQAESELFKIDLELRGKNPALDLVAEIGDIRDGQRVDEVIRRHGVDFIFHAAAYKHVPMMEHQVLEAARNNIVGTWNLVRAAQRNGVSNFLMISSDKAVNPTNVMGATKRVAELIVSARPAQGKEESTKFVSVRFGNVLGSNGSVVPLFQAQIASGGPITVTHPEIRRYFMTIREAVQLVLQAATMGKGSEIFVLDMGDPVRILDLAKSMIRLAGLVPDEDIEIRIVGLRPGEKLFEELANQVENMLPTYHEKIKIFQGPRPSRDSVKFWLLELEALLAARNAEGIVSHLKELVPEYRPDPFWTEERTTERVLAATASRLV